MAHNNVQLTHEKIHTGLSGLNNDDKWKDMLNFRSEQSTTVVLLPKFVVIPSFCAKLHTLISAPQGHNFAIGCRQSFGFVGGENLCPYPLWRLEQKYTNPLANRDGQSQRLVIRGSYTGSEPLKLKVSYVAGKLTPFWAVPTPVEPPAPAPEIDYGCGVNFSTFLVNGSIVDSDNEPVGDVLIEFIQFGFAVYSLRTDSFGRFTIPEFAAGLYTFRYSKDAYFLESEDVLIEEATVLDRVIELVTDWPAWQNAPNYQPNDVVSYDLSGTIYHFATDQTNYTGAPGLTSIGPAIQWVSRAVAYNWYILADTIAQTNTCHWFEGNLYRCFGSPLPAGLPGEYIGWDPEGTLFPPYHYRGLWRATTAYADNAPVSNEGVRYRATSSHTPSTLTEPGVGANWATVWELA
jgi:hypothetical protein